MSEYCILRTVSENVIVSAIRLNLEALIQCADYHRLMYEFMEPLLVGGVFTCNLKTKRKTENRSARYLHLSGMLPRLGSNTYS